MKFENTDYAKLWSSKEGRLIVSTILNTSGLIKPNYNFYLEKFKIDPAITPSNDKGEAIFTSEMRELADAEYMDMRAPLGRPRIADKKGVTYYTGRIPDFAPAGFKETAMERYYKETMFEQFGDTALIAQYATNELQRMIDSANMTLSYLAAKALSTGETIYDMGDGIKSAIYKSYIPTENFTNAGSAVWTSPAALILNEMKDIEDRYKDLWGVEMSMQWEIKQETFDACFLNNAQIMDWVIAYYAMKDINLSSSTMMTQDIVLEAIKQHPFGLSPISIVNQRGKDVNQGVVSGWKDTNVVYRPAGYAGYIRKAAILDKVIYEKYSNKVNSYNFTPVLNGLGVIMNSECVNGDLKEWHTDLFVKAIPTLDEFLYHVIVDISSANGGGGLKKSM